MTQRQLRRLGRAEAVAALPVEVAPATLPAADDAGDLAGEMAAAFGRLVDLYREHYQLSPQEARDRAGEDHPALAERALNAPPDQVSWFDLDTIARADPEKARGRWREIVQAARDELRGGHRAARAIEGGDGG